MQHTVDTDALDGSARAVSDLSVTTNTAREALHSIRVLPGGFAEAAELRTKVEGVVTAYVETLGKVRNSLVELSEALKKVSSSATQTEQNNTAAAQMDPFAGARQELGV